MSVLRQGWASDGSGILNSRPRASRRSGSALIVALWVLLILSLLIGSFAYDMQVEANITSFYRKRLKSQFVARAGLEYAKLFLAKSLTAKKEGPEDDEDEDTYVKAMNLQRGMGLSGVSQNVGQGKFTLDILPEAGRRNVNKLTDDDWEEILDQANVPEAAKDVAQAMDILSCRATTGTPSSVSIGYPGWQLRIIEELVRRATDGPCAVTSPAPTV